MKQKKARRERQIKRQRIEKFIYRASEKMYSDQDIAEEFYISIPLAKNMLIKSPYLIQVDRKSIENGLYRTYWSHIDLMTFGELSELIFSNCLDKKSIKKINRRLKRVDLEDHIKYYEVGEDITEDYETNKSKKVKKINWVDFSIKDIKYYIREQRKQNYAEVY